MAETVKFDARLAEGMAYFEQMLDILPDDRSTLEFLVVAYAQQGEKAKEEAMLARLARLLAREGDLTALEGLIPRLEAASDPQTRAVAVRAKALVAPQPDLTPEVPREQSEDEMVAELKRRAIEAECSLVDWLASENILAENESKMVKDHIQASPCDGRVFLISALQILEKENSPLGEKALAHVADKMNTPPIPLAMFESRAEFFEVLPVPLVRIRGIVPFAKLGTVTLVAMLNTADEKLRDYLSATLGTCRFYLADPAAIESILNARFASAPQEAS